MQKLQNQRGHLQDDPFELREFVCRKPGDLAPFLRGEDEDSTMKRILANIHQHAAVLKHWKVRNLRAVAKCDKGILHDHSSFKRKESAKVIREEKSGIALMLYTRDYWH